MAQYPGAAEEDVNLRIAQLDGYRGTNQAGGYRIGGLLHLNYAGAGHKCDHFLRRRISASRERSHRHGRRQWAYETDCCGEAYGGRICLPREAAHSGP
jgi:hypothetical protein